MVEREEVSSISCRALVRVSLSSKHFVGVQIEMSSESNQIEILERGVTCMDIQVLVSSVSKTLEIDIVSSLLSDFQR